MRECGICQGEIPATKVIDGKKRNLNNRKFCLICVPFGAKNSKLLENAVRYNYNVDTHKICGRCAVVKEIEGDYYKKDKELGTYYSYCKTCLSEISTDGQKDRKQKAVDYKGGKCVHCGYNKCLAALDFHHLDPNEKDYEPAKLFGQNQPWDKIKMELDKCILLCANCHREEHDRLKINKNERNRIREDFNSTKWPDVETLIDMGKRMNVSKICRELNLSPSTVIRKFNDEAIEYQKLDPKDQPTKINWPSDKDLAIMIEKSSSLLQLSRQLGVSDNSIRKRCKSRNIKYK